MLSFAILATVAVLHGNILVSTNWLAENLDKGDVVIVDIGTQQEFTTNHIPAARAIDAARLAVKRAGKGDEIPTLKELDALLTEAGIADAKQIVIYSREPLLATRAFFTFDYVGLGDRIAILDGGLPKWMAEKRPLESGSARSHATPNFHGVRHDEIVAYRDVLRERLRRPAAPRLIDARPVEQFNGEEPGAEIAVAGHIPSAKCMPWQANLDAAGNGVFVFKTSENLKSIYVGLGVSERVPTIVYCRTGMEASMTYFVLRYLGYTPALYDGSYEEWNQSKPTARMTSR